MITALQKEDLRHAVLEFLAVRFPAAHGLAAVRRRIERELDFKFEDDDLTAALEFLREKGLAKFVFDDLGSTRWWSATAEGVQAYERRA